MHSHTYAHQPSLSVLCGPLQVTVNNQIVIGTLMNICDDPNRVSIGAGWRENDTIRRVPIIVTGNTTASSCYGVTGSNTLRCATYRVAHGQLPFHVCLQ